MGRRIQAPADGPETFLLRPDRTAVCGFPDPAAAMGAGVPRAAPVPTDPWSRPAGPDGRPADRHLVSATGVESTATGDVDSLIASVRGAREWDCYVAAGRGGFANRPATGPAIADQVVFPAITPEYVGAAGRDVPQPARTAATTVHRLLTDATRVLAPRAGHLTRATRPRSTTVETLFATVPDTGRIHGLGTACGDVPRRRRRPVPPVRSVRPVIPPGVCGRHGCDTTFGRVRVHDGCRRGPIRLVGNVGDDAGRPVPCESRWGSHRVIRGGQWWGQVWDVTNESGRR